MWALDGVTKGGTTLLILLLSRGWDNLQDCHKRRSGSLCDITKETQTLVTPLLSNVSPVWCHKENHYSAIICPELHQTRSDPIHHWFLPELYVPHMTSQREPLNHWHSSETDTQGGGSFRGDNLLDQSCGYIYALVLAGCWRRMLILEKLKGENYSRQLHCSKTWHPSPGWKTESKRTNFFCQYSSSVNYCHLRS